jgi:hypothetical protein
VYTRFNKVSFQWWLQDWRHLLLRRWLEVSNSELKVMLLLRLVVILNLLDKVMLGTILLRLGILNRLDVMLDVVLLDVILDVMCHRALRGLVERTERIFKLVWLVRIGLRNVNGCTSSRTSLWRLQWWRKRMNSILLLEMLELMPAMICHSKDQMIDDVGPW